jgi:hypothetical protein
MEAYKRGSHTVWDCKYHVVWVTKYRHPVLAGTLGNDAENCCVMRQDKLQALTNFRGQLTTSFARLANIARMRPTPPIFSPQDFCFLCRGPRLQASPFSSPKRRCLDGQKIKTSDVDSGRCAHLENLRQKEDTSIKHCSLPKTIRGGYSAKGVQPWAVPRFTSLML